jgi:hypothetical protein
MKAVWHLINKEVGKPSEGGKKIEVYDGTEIISDRQKVADMLNNYFVETIDDLLIKNNKNNTNTQVQKQGIIYCPNTIFIHPVTEYEMECVIKSLKGKLSTGYDEYQNI